MAVLLQYNLTSSFAASTTASGVTGGTITNQSLSALTRGTAGYATDSVSSANPPDLTTNAAAAIANDSYFYVSITPTSGNQISLTSLTFSAARGGSSTPRGYDVRSSIDNYVTTLGTANLTTQRTTFSTITIDLNTPSFQNVSSTITFRIYIFCPSSVNSVDWDDLTINGSVSSGGVVDQEGFRWRADDGTETTATWLAAQDTNVVRQALTNTRLRVILNSTLNRGSEQYQLEYRKVGDATWNVIE